MPRRFAILLILLLASLVGALLVARQLRQQRVSRSRVTSAPAPPPTPVIPPTPLPARKIVLYFESAEDGKLHPEDRDVPLMLDDIALLRAIGSAVLEGPRSPSLLSPFPQGWRVRAAFRLKDGLAVLDLAPPPPSSKDERVPVLGRPLDGNGSHQELLSVQAIIISASRNIPSLTRFVLLVGGEAPETLGGHLDLTHPLVPDPSLVADEALTSPAPSPIPSPVPSLPIPVPTPGQRPGRSASV